MKERKKILLIQETDWILRGPHYHHHIIGRLNHNKYAIRIIDFPLIWDKDKRGEIPLIKGFQSFKINCRINPNKFVRIYRSPYINLQIFNILSIFLQRIIIKKVIRNYKPDLIICFASLVNVNYIIRLSKKYKIKFAYCLFEKYYTLIPYKLFNKFAKSLMERAIISSDINIVLTKFFKAFVDKLCGEGEKNIYIPQGVDIDLFDLKIKAYKKIKKYGINDDDIILFYMGLIYEFSGIKEVAQSIARNDNKNIKLMVVGEGGLYHELKEFVSKNNLNRRIILTGWVPYEEIPEYISMANICLLPAYKNEVMIDIVPIKMYEYLAMGKPTIATNLPGIKREFGINNGVVYVENPEQVINLVISKINYLNEQRIKAREFAERYDWKEIVKQFESFLKKIL